MERRGALRMRTLREFTLAGKGVAETQTAERVDLATRKIVSIQRKECFCPPARRTWGHGAWSCRGAVHVRVLPNSISIGKAKSKGK